jgi:hypothetical protein
LVRSLSDYGFREPIREFAIEDPALFESLINRLIEDLDLGAYVIARRENSAEITGDIVLSLIALLGTELDVGGHSLYEPNLLDPGPLRAQVAALARAPLAHSDEAIDVLTSILADQLSQIVNGASEAARREESSLIRARHFLPLCEDWPFPLNRFC